MLDGEKSWMRSAVPNWTSDMGAGVYALSIGSIAAGIFDLVWSNFEPGHQPIQAFGDHIPGRTVFAWITGLWLIAGGCGLLSRRTAQAGAFILAVIYAVFAVFHLPRFHSAPQVYGYHLTLFIGLLVGVFQQLIVVAAAVLLYASSTSPVPGRLSRVTRWVFGLASVDFGLAHFIALRMVAPMVPKWLPPGGNFWGITTGVAFVLAGVAILAKVQDVLAARLLALMLLVFSIFSLLPLPFASPRTHLAWGSNAYNLAAIGAVWIFAAYLSHCKNQHRQAARPAVEVALSRG